MKVASLFSGMGGIDLGFMQAGFDIIWANEYNHEAATTYRYNLNPNVLIEKDIRKVDALSIPDFDILIAGFPCQPFSIMGKQRGFDDPRGNLFFEIARIVDIKRPRIIFLENVQNLINHDSGKTFLVIYNTLASFGYCVKYRVLDAQEYGNVPQRRQRIFIIAFLNYDDCFKFEFPESIPLTCSLSDIFDRDTRQSDELYYTKESKYYEQLKRIVTEKDAVYRFFDEGLSPKPFYICPTLLASMGTMPNRVPIIIDNYGIRKLSPQECLKLQGFPDSFTFPNIPIKSAYKQCGNSVVVTVIKRIAEKIKTIEE